ncbi:hypothetical protein IU449_22025 [Nocardia higoensis]|uniref:Uncharacterized protein n=1 Tax=Nocardia higoensis TaxID=228599 RepID=A0ABS0DFD8_9NOCA|nr:hypothetical protein [Nocardia higoensis]MBF6357188.1 hypothetical protein [Nocardia higoensis]
MSVRADGRTIGYLDAGAARLWVCPATTSKIWFREYENWDGGVDQHANVILGLEDPALAIPVNEPPNLPYTTQTFAFMEKLHPRSVMSRRAVLA